MLDPPQLSFGSRLNAISLAPDSTKFAVAGRTVLQVIRLNLAALAERRAARNDDVEDERVASPRAEIIGAAALAAAGRTVAGPPLSRPGDGSKHIARPNSCILSPLRDFRTGKNRRTLSLSSNDVKWHPSPACGDILATAATNGAVIVWNISRPGQKARVLEVRHSRTASRVCWNPRGANELVG